LEPLYSLPVRYWKRTSLKELQTLGKSLIIHPRFPKAYLVPKSGKTLVEGFPSLYLVGYRPIREEVETWINYL
jgi:hypothetical protein